ncbi:MAG TPA: SRPBCC family protein [Acidimicrobiales bacterium]|nr:SRPBCC family protein [Acidimicrobiales bacterium]
MASLRQQRRINADVETVWDIVRRPESIPDWFPGIVSCTVNGRTRVIRTATGLEFSEEILTIDPLLHRFVYRVTSHPIQFHLGVIDVIAIAPRDCLCIYSTTAEPDVFALLIGGGTAAAVDEIKRQAEVKEGNGNG